MKRGVDCSTIIIGDFDTSLTIMKRAIRQKIRKQIEDLNDKINHLDLTDIHRTLYPKQEQTHSSQVHNGHFPG